MGRVVPGARTMWCPAPGFRPLLWPRLLSPSRVGAGNAVGNVPCTVHRVGLDDAAPDPR